MIEYLNDFLSVLDKLQGLPAAALVALSCLAVGYALKFIRAFPNSAIPLTVILWGGLVMLFIADPRQADVPARIWTTRNLLVGLVIGAGCWLLHYYFLYKLEDWIAAKFPGVSDTAFFRNKTDTATTTTKGQSNDETKTPSP